MNHSQPAIPFFLLTVGLNVVSAHYSAHATQMGGERAVVKTVSALNDSPALSPRSLESSPYTIADLAPLPVLLVEQQARQWESAVQMNQPLNIGVARQIPNPSISFNQLNWTKTDHNSRVAFLTLKSAQAKALRLNIVLESLSNTPSQHDEVLLRFKGSDGRSFESSGRSFAQQFGDWTPIVAGDVMTLEIEIPASIQPEQLRFYLPVLSHLFVSPIDSNEEINQITKGKMNPSCEQDVACNTDQTPGFANIRDAVARMVFTDKGYSYLCTGTLLNNGNTPKRHLFWTAAHCISRNDVAKNLQTYWFYEASACQSRAINPHFVALDGGARLLYTNLKRDTSLLELKKAPPSGAFYAGWTSDAILEENNPVLGIHHPKGMLKKYAQGYLSRLFTHVNDKQWFYGVIWDKGQIDFGSSGSGLFTRDGQGNYLLRGGLYAAKFPQCSVSADSEVFYSRFSDVYPMIKQYLLPSFTP